MRTLILSTLCAFTLSTLFAQQADLAYVDLETTIAKNIAPNNRLKHSVSPNAGYLENLLNEEFPKVVKNWKYRIANYNLNTNSVFDNSEKATYQIAFKNKQVNIVAIYNNKGKILSTNETYKNIRLPFKLLQQITKMHPNLSILKNTYHTFYNYKTGVRKSYYKIQIISKGGKKATLKFNSAFKTI